MFCGSPEEMSCRYNKHPATSPLPVLELRRLLGCQKRGSQEVQRHRAHLLSVCGHSICLCLFSSRGDQLSAVHRPLLICRQCSVGSGRFLQFRPHSFQYVSTHGLGQSVGHRRLMLCSKKLRDGQGKVALHTRLRHPLSDAPWDHSGAGEVLAGSKARADVAHLGWRVELVQNEPGIICTNIGAFGPAGLNRTQPSSPHAAPRMHNAV